MTATGDAPWANRSPLKFFLLVFALTAPITPRIDQDLNASGYVYPRIVESAEAAQNYSSREFVYRLSERRVS